MRFKTGWLLVSLLLVFGLSAWAATSNFYLTAKAGTGGTVNLPGKTNLATLNHSGPTNVVFTAMSSNYYLSGLKVNNQIIGLTGHKGQSYSFSNYSTNYNIAATFTKHPIITVSVSAGGEAPAQKSVLVPYSSAKTITFTAKTGYHPTAIKVNGVTKETNIDQTETTLSHTFDAVTKNTTINGAFAINVYDVGTAVLPGPDAGTISPTGLTGVKYGQKKTFVIKPTAGMTIGSIDVNGDPVTLPSSYKAGASYSLQVTVTDDTAITVTFAEIHPAGQSKLQGTYQFVNSSRLFTQYSGAINPSSNRALKGQKLALTFGTHSSCSISATGSEFTDAQGTNVKVDTAAASTKCRYSTDDNGTGAFTLTLTKASAAISELIGWVSQDGMTVVMGGTNTPVGVNGDYETSLATGIKAGTGMSKSSLNGTFSFVAQNAELAKTTNVNVTDVTDSIEDKILTITFDGNGTCINTATAGQTFVVKADNTGVDTTQLTDVYTGCTYTVSGTGAVAVTSTIGSTTTKTNYQLSADGNILLAGGDSQATITGGKDYDVKNTVAVKASDLGMDVSSVAGTYQIIGLSDEFDVADSVVTSAIGSTLVTVALDGAGGCNLRANGTSFTTGPNHAVLSSAFNSDDWSVATCEYTVDTTADNNIGLQVILRDAGATIVADFTGVVSADGNTVLFGTTQLTTELLDQFGFYSTSTMVGVRTEVPTP
jgi:hypothetical protein